MQSCYSICFNGACALVNPAVLYALPPANVSQVTATNLASTEATTIPSGAYSINITATTQPATILGDSFNGGVSYTLAAGTSLPINGPISSTITVTAGSGGTARVVYETCS